MTDTVPVSRELLRRVLDFCEAWPSYNGKECADTLRAALDATCQDSRQVQTAAEWVRCAAHGAQHDVREIIADMQAAPVQEPVYAFRRKGMDDFCTCNKARFDELASKPHLFETAIFYTAQPRKAVKLTNIHKAVIGHDHFGNPIPKEWYAAAEQLESAVLKANGVTE